jgi:hypothetical protein
MSGTEGADYVILEIVNHHEDSNWEFRVTCPELYSDEPIIAEPSATISPCGRNHHQSGFAKTNTIDLGTSPGMVYVDWTVQGSAEVKFYQGPDLLATIKSNRSGQFDFYYDPAKGPIYAISMGTGTVDYMFSCPYLPPDATLEKYEYTCGSGAQEFDAPKAIDIILPDRSGSVQIDFTTEETVVLKFYQGDNLFYIVQQFAGTASFSLDYIPTNGNVRVVSENYGKFSLAFACPYVEPALPPATPISVIMDCGTQQTINGLSNVTVNFLNQPSGTVTVTYSITGDNNLSFMYAGAEIAKGLPGEGTKTFTFELSSAIAQLYVNATGQNSYSLDISCPVVPATPELSMNCGQTQFFDSPVNIDLVFQQPGNFQISSDVSALLFDNGVQVGTLGSVAQTFLYSTGDAYQIKSSDPGSITVNVGCPSVKTMTCPATKTVLAGDILDVNIGTNTGVAHIIVTTDDPALSLAWYVGGSLLKTTIGSAEFDLTINSPVTVEIVSSGTGSYTVQFPCPAQQIDTYTTTADQISDLSLPIPSAGTICASNLISRAYKQSAVDANVANANLVTMVRDITTNHIVPTATGAEFSFLYEFPLALPVGDYTVILRADEANADVAMYIGCWPALDWTRNQIATTDLTIVSDESFVQIKWKFVDDITKQTQMTGGIYAAIIDKASGLVIWKSGDDMVHIRHNAPLVNADNPVVA